MVDRNSSSPSGINNKSSLPSLPHDLIAEWTIKAQLKCRRAGQTIRRECHTTDTVDPVKVFHKCYASNDNVTSDNIEQSPNVSESIKIDTNIRTTPYSELHSKSYMNAPYPSHLGGAQSTTSSMTCDDLNVATALSGPSSAYESRNIRCQSTCNVVISAVADFLPMSKITEMTEKNVSADSTIYFDSAYMSKGDDFTSTVTPSEKVISGKDLGKNLEQTIFSKTVSFCDATCQTSDTEVHKSNDPKRLDILTDYITGALHNHINMADVKAALIRGHHFMPSLLQSSAQIFKSISMPCMPISKNNYDNRMNSPTLPFGPYENAATFKSDPPKKSRTVHIDVYCTGSEDENQADIESSSSEERDMIKYRNKTSTSSYQTILNNDQMNLKHQRIDDKMILPRRLLKQQKSLSDKEQKVRPRTPLVRSKEGKNYVCNQHDAQKFQNLRQKYFRQTSDCFSTNNYSNLPHIPMYDNYESNANSFMVTDDFADVSQKEFQDPYHSTLQGYMYPISADIKETKMPLGNNNLEKGTHQTQIYPDESKNHVTKQNFSNYSKTQQVFQNPSKFLQFFCPNKQKINLNYVSGDNNIKDTYSGQFKSKEHVIDSSQRTSQSKWYEKNQKRNSQKQSTNSKTFSMPISKIELKRYEMSLMQSPVYQHLNELNLTGYSNEYLNKARKFGEVVSLKKPDHHIGPTKNPNCLCESCQRWKIQRLVKRDVGDFSLDERSCLKKLQ